MHTDSTDGDITGTVVNDCVLGVTLSLRRVATFALCTIFPERGSHCIVTSLSANKYFLIKQDRVSCTNYFMSIHNIRYNVQLIIIATQNNEIFEKFQDFSASNNYVRVIDTSAVMVFT